jgi:hypothetical protein
MGGLTVTLGFMHELWSASRPPSCSTLTRVKHVIVISCATAFFAALADSFKHSLKRDSMCDLFVRLD